jgi:hypothetical protein
MVSKPYLSSYNRTNQNKTKETKQKARDKKTKV